MLSAPSIIAVLGLARVTFTDWRGSLVVYTAIWLTPVYLAIVLTRGIQPLVLAPYIYLAMMAQHKLHRARGLTTASRYEEIDVEGEWRWFWILLSLALLSSLPLLVLYPAAAVVALAAMAMIILYSGPLHREWWIGVCHYAGTMAAFLTVGPPGLGEALLAAGFSSLVWMLHKGLRIVTGDYGPVPVGFRHVAEVFASWLLGLVFIYLGLWVGV